MILLNFSHPLTQAQLERLEELTGRRLERTVELPVQFDQGLPFQPQVAELIARLPLSPQELQTAPILVNLPGLSTIAALLLAELHGRMGHFPPVLRLRLRPNSLPPSYEVAEILNLQAVRDAARGSAAAVELGKRGGSVKSARKAAAARLNGRRGGRPKKNAGE